MSIIKLNWKLRKFYGPNFRSIGNEQEEPRSGHLKIGFLPKISRGQTRTSSGRFLIPLPGLGRMKLVMPFGQETYCLKATLCLSSYCVLLREAMATIDRPRRPVYRLRVSSEQSERATNHKPNDAEWGTFFSF